MPSAIETVESTLIQAVKSRLGTAIKGCESLGGPWSVDELMRTLQIAPTVRVAFLGGQPDADGERIDGSFAVYCIAGGALEKARRLGSPNVIGAYDMVSLLVPALNRLPFPNASDARIVSIDNLFGEALFDLGGAVYGIRLSVPNLELPPVLDEAALDDFTKFRMQMDIPPHASAAQHALWIEEPPNYTTSAPDAEGAADAPA